MSAKDSNVEAAAPSKEPGRQARSFALPDDDESSTGDRQARTFTPDSDASLEQTPEAITAGERLPHVSEYSGIKLEALPLRGLKRLGYLLLTLLVIVGSWELGQIFVAALTVHWGLAAAFTALLLWLLGQSGRLIWQLLRGRESVQELHDLRKQAGRLREGHDFGRAQSYVKTLQNFYEDKPQHVFLMRCLQQLPDYSNDREVIEHIERGFLGPLDQEAQRRISNYSMQTAVAVAASPWTALDMALSLWRSLSMIEDVAQVYGVRPSTANRWRLMRQVINQLTFVGATDMAVDQAVDIIEVESLFGLASAHIGQGLGAGVYSARIGLAAMLVSRPVVFQTGAAPKLRGLIRPMLDELKRMGKGLMSR